MSASFGTFPDDPPPSGGAVPLVPLLSVDDGLSGPSALATWHEALSAALRIEIPHDLLALWLFPIDGSVVLVGPEALAQDQLEVPLPSPQLRVAQLDALASVFRRAGYPSTICVPIRFGRRDVGLLLVADLRPGLYGDAHATLLHWTAQRLAPTMGRLARLWTDAATSAADHDARLTTLIDALSALRADGQPRDFARALSDALQHPIPHDRLELLVSTSPSGRWFRLGEHAGGAWTDAALTIERDVLDIAVLFADGDRLVIADTYADQRWPRGFLTASDAVAGEAELRALVGARMPLDENVSAYLLLGSVGPEFYREADAVLLDRVARLLRSQVAELARSGRAATPAPADEAGPKGPVHPPPLVRIAELLATTVDVASALQAVVDEARLLLPFRELRYVIRLSDIDRVVLLQPGERRSLADLPLMPIAGTALAAVLRGDQPYFREATTDESRLVVPLRVAGRIHGAIALSARRADAFEPAAVLLAQYLADLLAPHVELLRRATLFPAPFAPGWKRTGR